MVDQYYAAIVSRGLRSFLLCFLLLVLSAFLIFNSVSLRAQEAEVAGSSSLSDTGQVNASSAETTKTVASSNSVELQIEEVFVTGSLIPKGDFVSKAPIATISSTQFEMTNTTNVEALINSMPQVVGGADRSSTFGQGIATANLRGLGENRTLVLVNSRRFVPTFPDGGTVDLNFIPVGLIDRVEVLTGGASAAYGSDALAGVINFILKEETDGWEANAGYELTERGDSEIFNFNITNGGEFASGKGKYLIHFDYLEREPTFFTDRSLTTRSLVDIDDGSGNLTLGPGRNRFPVTLNAIALNPVAAGFDNGFGTLLFQNDGGVSVNRFVTGDADAAFDQAVADNPISDLNAYSFLQLPQERHSFKGRLSYDFGAIEPYVDVYYSKSEVPQTFAGAFMGFPTAYGYEASIENSPFLTEEAKRTVSDAYFNWNLFQPDQVRYTDANQNGIADQLRFPFLFRLFTEYGPWENDRSFESLQVEFGIRGDISPTWGYDVFVQLGEVESSTDINPLLNPQRIQQALLLDDEGNCVDPSNGCVPLNFWADDIGAEAAEFIRYPQGAGESVTNNKQNVFMATLSGNTAGWFSLPGDPGPIGLVVGYEYRELDAQISTPEFVEQGIWEGGGVAPVPWSLDQRVTFSNILAEAAVPLVSGLPGIDFLELELGIRSSDHSRTGRDNTYKIALSYYPTADIQLRASYNKAIRSPAINELFSNDISLGYIFDPCKDPGPLKAAGDGSGTDFAFLDGDSSLRATCIATGVPEQTVFDPTYYNGTPQRNLGGNPDLEPEDATTYSVGVVWTPYDFGNFSISFDYFKVEIEDYIELTPVSSGQLILGCYDSSRGVGGAGSGSCNSLTRDSNGSLVGIFGGYQNLGLHEVDGFDLNIEYGRDFFSGYLDVNYFATKLLDRTIQDNTYGDVFYSCIGKFNSECDNLIDYPVFDFKHRMTVGWTKGDLELQLVWKYQSALDDGDDDIEYFREKLEPYSLVDLSGRYRINDTLSLTAGAKNIFDEKPQAIGSNSWEWLREDIPTFSNTYTQYYDVFGRTFFLKLSARF